MCNLLKQMTIVNNYSAGGRHFVHCLHYYLVSEIDSQNTVSEILHVPWEWSEWAVHLPGGDPVQWESGGVWLGQEGPLPRPQSHPLKNVQSVSLTLKLSKRWFEVQTTCSFAFKTINSIPYNNICLHCSVPQLILHFGPSNDVVVSSSKYSKQKWFEIPHLTCEWNVDSQDINLMQWELIFFPNLTALNILFFKCCSIWIVFVTTQETTLMSD